MRKLYAIGHRGLTLLTAPFASQLIDCVFSKNPRQVVGLLEAYPISLLS